MSALKKVIPSPPISASFHGTMSPGGPTPPPRRGQVELGLPKSISRLPDG